MFLRSVWLTLGVVANNQLNEIISSADAWDITEEISSDDDDAGTAVAGMKPTVSSRQIKALIEQITGA